MQIIGSRQALKMSHMLITVGQILTWQILLFININKSKISETKSKNDEDVVHRKMSTLRDIFLYCKSHNINEYLYDQQIKYVFLDHRTEHIYSKYMEEGNKLICYQMHYYIPEKK